MNAIINTFNKIIKKSECKSCINCHKTPDELAGSDDSMFPHISRSSRPKEYFSITKKFCDENLCLNCEIIMYPDRFHGCGFCKRPIREKFSCTICTRGFNSWIRSQICGSDALSHMLRISADSLLDKQVIFVDDNYDPNSNDLNSHLKHKFILRTSDNYYKWPGFYSGATNKFNTNDSSFFPVWIIPKLNIEQCVKFANLKPNIKMFQRMILELLEGNNIKLYEDIQIDLKLFDMSKIIEANPYDTQIVTAV